MVDSTVCMASRLRVNVSLAYSTTIQIINPMELSTVPTPHSILFGSPVSFGMISKSDRTTMITTNEKVNLV
jgi:hypothetical protein